MNAQSVPNSPATISTVATPGATLFLPTNVAVDQQNNLYIADADGSRILKVNQQTGVASVYAGTGLQLVTGQPNGDGGLATSAVLSRPQSLAVAANGDLYFVEQGVASDVRKVTAVTGMITTVASGLQSPTGLAYNDADRILYISAALGSLGVIAKLDANGSLFDDWFVDTSHPAALTYSNGYVYFLDNDLGEVVKIGPGNSFTVALSGLSKPAGLAPGPSGDIYVSLSGDPSQSTGGQRVFAESLHRLDNPNCRKWCPRLCGRWRTGAERAI